MDFPNEYDIVVRSRSTASGRKRPFKVWKCLRQRTTRTSRQSAAHKINPKAMLARRDTCALESVVERLILANRSIAVPILRSKISRFWLRRFAELKAAEIDVLAVGTPHKSLKCLSPTKWTMHYRAAAAPASGQRRASICPKATVAPQSRHRHARPAGRKARAQRVTHPVRAEAHKEAAPGSRSARTPTADPLPRIDHFHADCFEEGPS